jgi:hypothetical protein
MKHLRLLAVCCCLLGAAYALNACGGEAAAPKTDQPSTSLLKVWCDVKLGESKPQVLAKMGAPNGRKVPDSVTSAIPGAEASEWNVEDTILLATFEGGKATNLQAYDGAVGPQGSSKISCPSFRNRG